MPAEYTEVPLGVGDLLVIDPMLMHSASTNAGEVSAPLSPSDFLISQGTLLEEPRFKRHCSACFGPEWKC